MKRAINLLFLLLGMLVFANLANAESPRKHFSQMVEQLQASPDDNALRENIIKLAQKLKPAPSIPEEARRHFVKAVTLQKDAKSPEDYDLPIQEYRQALLLAPWWSDAYYDLSSALELKQHYAEAIQNLKFSILASPNGPDARAAQDKVYALEAKSEKKAKDDDEKAQKDNAVAEQERFYKSLDGGKWKEIREIAQADHGESWPQNVSEDYIEIHGSHLEHYHIYGNRRVSQWGDGLVFSNRNFNAPDINGDMLSYRFIISEDGNSITIESEENTCLIQGNTNCFRSLIHKSDYERIK